MSFAFWCSKCKVDHAGECPPEKTSAASQTPSKHDWVRLATIDLNYRFACSMCSLRAAIPGHTSRPEDLLPVGPCPGVDAVARVHKAAFNAAIDAQNASNKVPLSVAIDDLDVTDFYDAPGDHFP